MKKPFPPINGQTRYEKFIDLLATDFSALQFLAVHIGSLLFLLFAIYITQNVLNNFILLDLSVMLWLALEILNLVFMLLGTVAQTWGMRHEQEIAVRVKTYVTEHNNCTYDELAIHCMPRKIHVGLESAVQRLISIQKIVRYSDNGTIRLRLPTEEELLTWYIESGERLRFSMLQELFDHVIPDYDDHLEIEFFLFEKLRCRMGQIPCSGTDGYTFWLCAEDTPRASFATFEDMFSAAVFHGKSLRDLWADALVTEINGEYAEEWLHVYDSRFH